MDSPRGIHSTQAPSGTWEHCLQYLVACPKYGFILSHLGIKGAMLLVHQANDNNYTIV